MLISFLCPSCEFKLEVDAEAIGRTVKCSECGESITVPKVRAGPGTTIGGFKIETLIGKGGMGEVYLARQISMGRNVALKILPPQFTVSENNVQRFLKEVRMAARLEHPNVVRAYEAGEDNGVYFLAMAFVDGETVEHKLDREGPMPEREALEIIRKSASALAYAWNEHHIVHRDIKPSNIMLSRRGETLLADLGLSKSTEETGMTMSGTVMGTPNYMSPEQAEGHAHIDFRCDIYSLGATLYHMLTGNIPFHGSSVIEILRKQLTETLPDPRESNLDVSGDTVTLMERMLAKKPGNRQASWEEVIREIDGVLSGAPSLHATMVSGESVLIRADTVVATVVGGDGPTPLSGPAKAEQEAREKTDTQRGEGDRHRRPVEALQPGRSGRPKKSGVARAAAGVLLLGLAVWGITALRKWAKTSPTPSPVPVPPAPPETVQAPPEEQWHTLPNGLKFGKPVSLGPAVNSDARDTGPCVSADGGTLVFSSDRSGGRGGEDLWMSGRPDPGSPWGEPENLGTVVNSAHKDGSPCLSWDGLTLLFVSNRPDGQGSTDLWMSTRAEGGGPWSRPVNLGSTVNSATSEGSPCLSPDGLTLIFDSERQADKNGIDLWQATRAHANAPWSEPVRLGSMVNCWDRDQCAGLSGDGLALFFMSGLEEGYGGRGDLWMSTRDSAASEWGESVHLGPFVNTSAFESEPCVSADGQWLYFMSDRPGGYGEWDLYCAPIQRPANNESAKSQPETWLTLPNGWKVGWPENLGPVVNSDATEVEPAVSADGSSLIFASERSGGHGSRDLWMSQRSDPESPWGKPVNLGSVVNSQRFDDSPSLSSDSLTLVFDSDRDNRSCGGLWMSTRTDAAAQWRRPVRVVVPGTENLGGWRVLGPHFAPDGMAFLAASKEIPGGVGDYDLWMSRRSGPAGTWERPVSLGAAVNCSGPDLSPCLSADGLVLLFQSSRAGGLGRTDFWMSTRTDAQAPWREPVNLGPCVNSRYAEHTASLSTDGRRLYFTSDRPGGYGKQDIYCAPIRPAATVQREVREVQVRQQPSVATNKLLHWLDRQLAPLRHR